MADLAKISNGILDLLYEDIRVFEHFTSQRHLVASSISISRISNITFNSFACCVIDIDSV